MKWLVAILALVLAFVWFIWLGRWTYHWKEEVLLHDGRVIIVERSVKTGYVPVEMGQSPGESDYTLTFKGPEGRSITWHGGRDRFRPMILDFADGVPFVVARGATSLVYGAEGCPRPPYFFFRWRDGDWERIAYREFPKAISKLNLSVDPTYEESVRQAMRNGLVGVRDVQRTARDLNPEDKQVREDAPPPMDCVRR